MDLAFARAKCSTQTPLTHLKGHFMTSLITKTGSAAVLALLLCGAVQAQQAPAASSDSDWRFFGLGNATFGGDSVYKEALTDGTSIDIKAGGLLQFGLGAEYKINNAWAASASLSYHVDDDERNNGKLSFSRMPIELMGHFEVSEQFRLSAGLRKSLSAKAKSSGVVSGAGSDKFDSSMGVVLEGEYFLKPERKLSMTVRFVQESFDAQGSGTNKGTKFDGKHIGIGLKAYF